MCRQCSLTVSGRFCHEQPDDTVWMLPDSCTRLHCRHVFHVWARGLRDLTVPYPPNGGGALAGLLACNPALTALRVKRGPGKGSRYVSDDVTAQLLRLKALTELSVRSPFLPLDAMARLPSLLLRSLKLLVPEDTASADCVSLIAALRSLENCRIERDFCDTPAEESTPLPPLTAAADRRSDRSRADQS